jgi:hypothetical protein
MKTEDQLEIDELLIRPLKTDIYSISGDTITKNNCAYFPTR